MHSSSIRPSVVLNTRLIRITQTVSKGGSNATRRGTLEQRLHTRYDKFVLRVTLIRHTAQPAARVGVTPLDAGTFLSFPFNYAKRGWGEGEGEGRVWAVG
jgi:hypothetical protein